MGTTDSTPVKPMRHGDHRKHHKKLPAEAKLNNKHGSKAFFSLVDKGWHCSLEPCELYVIVILRL